MAQSIKNNIRGGNVILELDMNMAYDSISWLRLMKIMRKCGFGEAWINIVFKLISNCWYSVLIMDKQEVFSTNRGIKQGDPLSLYLFLIASEALSRGLNHIQEKYPSTEYFTRRGLPIISHLAYADAVMVFCYGSARSIRLHNAIFKSYQFLTGQIINLQKSCFIA